MSRDFVFRPIRLQVSGHEFHPRNSAEVRVAPGCRMSRVCRLFVANASSVLHVFIKSGRTPIFVFYDQISLWVGLNASAFFHVYLRALLGIQSLNCDRYLLDTSDIRSFHDKQKNTVNYCTMRKRSFLQYPGYN